MKKMFHLLIIAIIGVLFIYGLTNIVLNFKGYTGADFLIVAIMLAFVALLELVLIKQYKRTYSLEAEEARKQREADRTKEKFDVESKILGSKSRQQLIGADLCIKAKHMAGLPIADGAEIFVYRCKDKVVFERNQDTIELDINKVRDILIKTDVEIQKSYVSSAGGAVGGYVLFGPLGAMIGGRAKEKKSTKTEKYLIFAYEKDGETDYISMEVTNEPNASLFNSNYYDLSKNERKLTSL
ncbi:hypothetical protein [Lysinibacillus xylanilyticus]|uniref:Uncharacterized protein n=1 Tax=Lysinibacillus xylanilyticus TaxID=582475 RepID=A0A2M9Q795_9BACI|nr:hypothetical protein [Lysinibacillus xylanilyticus]PJO43923.1 hypothetical protein CWD94_10065 [Lysinibacillus xylanilyticus]